MATDVNILQGTTAGAKSLPLGIANAHSPRVP